MTTRSATRSRTTKETSIELALVLCSIAVLTRRSPFWFAGIGVGAVGFVVAMCAFVGPVVHLFEH